MALLKRWIFGRRGCAFYRLLFLLFVTLCLTLTFSEPAAGGDLVVAVDDGGRLYSAQWDSGSGAFTDFVRMSTVTGNARGITMADFDNDGDMDLIVGRDAGSSYLFYYFENDGTNTFSGGVLKGTISQGGSYAEDMAAGDFNNDGNIDFIGNTDTAYVAVFLGDGRGNFTKLADMSLASNGRGLDVADFNFDGNLDFVRAVYSSGVVYVYLGNGDGTFNTAAPITVGDPGSDPYGVAAGDFNEDGQVDVVANAGSGGDARLYTGNWDGTDLTFTDQGLIATLDPNNHGSYDAFDYNGDGHLDVVISDYSGRDLYYYPGTEPVGGIVSFGTRVKINTFDTTDYALSIAAPPIGPPAGVPVAVVSPASATIASGNSVDFDGSGSSDSGGTITAWSWAFGDGGTDTVQDPLAHTYSNEGIYMAGLKVTDDTSKSASAFARVVVQGAAPSVDTTPVTFGEVQADDGLWSLALDGATYASDTEGITSYQWNLGDGLTEGFEDGDAAGWTVYAGTWAINSATPIGGSYSYQQTNTTLDRTWTLFEKVFDTDITIEADVRLVSGTPGNGGVGEEAHIIFRAKDADNNYEFILRGRGLNDILLYRRVNGSPTNLLEYDLPAPFSSPNYIDVGGTYHLKIVCTGSLIQFYLDGRFLFGYYDSTFFEGRVGLSTYDSSVLFDNLTVAATATGELAWHAFEAGTYNVELSVTDTAGQTAAGTIPMTMQPGTAPVANSGGPYTVGESAAFEGGWTVALNGAASTDDVEIRKYIWDLGTDAFDGTVVNAGKWIVGGHVTQNDSISISTTGSGWGKDYIFSKDNYTRAKGMAFEAKVNQISGANAMVGFKNTNTTYQYGQMPYAIYFNGGNLLIYENGASRGDTGYNYSYNTWYEVRIELKDSAGARYYYRPLGATEWTLLYDSNNDSGTVFKRGVDVYSGTFAIDDLKEIAAGATPSYRIYGAGSHPVSLTVYDRAGQSSTDSTTVTNAVGDPPSGDAGPAQTKGEADAVERTWTFSFNAAAGSTDDHGIYTYEWDWNYDGTTFNPSGVTGATPSHTYTEPGIYTVAVRVTDHALQTDIDTLTATATEGDPPVANAGGPYTVDEFSGNAFEGGWTVTLDGSGSTDDVGIIKYFWDFGTDTFSGTAFNDGKWYTNGGISQNDAVSLTGSNAWDTRYLVTKAVYPKVKGQTFQARIKASGAGQVMFGLKNTSTTNFHYNQFPYKFYISSQTIYIYNGTSQVNTGFVIAYNNWYDFKIELTDAGAVYSYKPAAETSWTQVYNTSYTITDTSLRKGMVVYSNTYTMDDFQESTAGVTPAYTLYGLGDHPVSLTVYDNALQSDTATSTVTLLANDPPAANAGPDKVLNETTAFDGKWHVLFDGTGSTDDHGIYLYEWDWDYDGSFDPSGDKGAKFTHTFATAGTYSVALRVTDHALQSHIDAAIVTLTTGAPPVADAGGPYNAGAGGPPAHFNGSHSTDDFGVVKYLWDADITVDGAADADTDPTNDIDAVGRKPFYTYATAGTYTARLTVVDGAGQTDTADATVNVADNLAPEVICVPWRAGNHTIPHETYSGRSIRLKAIVRDAGTLEYRWAFGDGTFYPEDGVSWDTVGNKYIIEAPHTYPTAAAEGTPYTAVLTVRDSSGLIGTDNYYVVVKPDNYDTRTNIAIDEGLWYLHSTQNKTDGHWTSSYGTYPSSATSSSIQAFEINGHLQDGDNQENPYVETVNKGFDYFFATLAQTAITAQTYGNPDTNGNGIGIGVNSNRPIYEGGMAMDAIASSNNPRGFAATGGTGVKGRFYYEILTDMVDMYAWGQVDSGSYQGGWRYSWNSEADNSACQWAAIGMLAAEDTFGINIPQFVKDENADYWLNYSYNGTGFGYTGAGNGVATTPSGMVQLAFCDKETSDPRWQTAENYIATHWFWQNNNYYGIYALVKALRLARPNPVVTLSATGLDWYNDGTTGVRKRIVDQQATSGTTWGSWAYSTYEGRSHDTPWAVIMLTPTLFVQPPVADAGDDIIWAYGLELQFDASGSFHQDPNRRILKYEWDFDGDGTYEFETEDPSDPNAKHTYPDPNPETEGDPPQVITVTLRVTDDNVPSQTDIDTRKVTVAEPPHAPYAVHGGPYTATAGIPFTLDGSGSYDIDPGDSITRYEWDLDNDGVFFDNVDLDITNTTGSWTYPASGVYNIALRVTDNGAFNPLSCIIGVDCVKMVSLPVFTTVTVAANLPPVADAGGPYTVNEGTELILDGSGSSDPNGNALSYGWDLDNDGQYDDSTEASPTHTWTDNGTYTVGLKVSDSLLESTATATVTVNNVAPTATAGGDQTVNEGSTVAFGGSFTDPGSADTHTIAWNFGDGGTSSGTLTPTHVYADNGTYTVTLTVTDDDGGVGTYTMTVTVNNVAPLVDAGPDQSVNESDSVTFAGSFTDPGINDTHTIAWNFGDGGTSSGSLTPSHVYADNGIYTVTLTVTDNNGGVGTDTLTVTVGNVPPLVNAGPDQSVNEGGTVTFAGSFTDPGVNDTHTVAWSFGDGGTSSGTLTPSHVYADDGIYTVTLTVTDNNGGVGTDTLTVTVGNVAPAVNAGDDQAAAEGQTVAVAGSFSDPGSIDTHTIGWDFGDGGTASGTLTPSHVYADNGTYTVTLTVTDDDGGVGNDTLTVTVGNVAPAVDAGLDQSVNVSDSVSFNGGFSDPGSADTHTIGWDFGDGGTASGTLTPAHTYSAAGTYTVTLTVMDKDGGVGSDTLIVNVASTAAADLRPLCYVNTITSYNRLTRKWTVGWKLKLSNVGDAAATSVSASMTPASIPAGVTVLDGSMAWSGSIDPGESQLSDDDFRYVYSRTVGGPDLTQITWDIEYTDPLGVKHVVENIPQGSGTCP